MNIGRELMRIKEGFWTTDQLAREGWRLTEWCQGFNAFGLAAIFARGKERAGIKKDGQDYILVEVIL